MQTQTLTYFELGARLGITAESARRLAQRRRWRRITGNDGRARVVVPADAFDRVARDIPRDAAGDVTPDAAGDVTPDVTPPVAPVSPPVPAEIAELRARVAALAAELSGRDALLAELRTNLAAIAVDRDLWRGQAEALRAMLANAETRSARPWWQRLRG